MNLSVFSILPTNLILLNSSKEKLSEIQIKLNEVIAKKLDAPINYFLLSQLYANLNQYEQSINLLEVAVDKGFRHIHLLGLEPAFKPMFGLEKFDSIYKKLNELIKIERDQVMDFVSL